MVKVRVPTLTANKGIALRSTREKIQICNWCWHSNGFHGNHITIFFLLTNAIRGTCVCSSLR